MTLIASSPGEQSHDVEYLWDSKVTANRQRYADRMRFWIKTIKTCFQLMHTDENSDEMVGL